MKKAMLLAVFTALLSVCFCGKMEAIVCVKTETENSISISQKTIYSGITDSIPPLKNDKHSIENTKKKEPSILAAFGLILLTIIVGFLGFMVSLVFFLFALGIGECKPNTDCSKDNGLFAMGIFTAMATLLVMGLMIRSVARLFKKHKQARKTKTGEIPG